MTMRKSRGKMLCRSRVFRWPYRYTQIACLGRGTNSRRQAPCQKIFSKTSHSPLIRQVDCLRLPCLPHRMKRLNVELKVCHGAFYTKPAKTNDFVFFEIAKREFPLPFVAICSRTERLMPTSDYVLGQPRYGQPDLKQSGFLINNTIFANIVAAMRPSRCPDAGSKT